jgi:hypothetical protein
MRRAMSPGTVAGMEGRRFSLWELGEGGREKEEGGRRRREKEGEGGRRREERERNSTWSGFFCPALFNEPGDVAGDEGGDGRSEG